jgi:phosphoenolpyruvate synthase/pyruvate phosphate dikinase
MSEQVLVRGIADVGAADRHTVGGKGAALGELSRAGITVPPGYVVTAQAFEWSLRALDPAGTLRREIGQLRPGDGGGIARVAARVRQQIVAAPLPEDVRAVITAHYRGLGGDPEAGAHGAPVAVRSSATGEDSAEASFAGLQDTYLWVRGAESVLDHVRRCWASLYNAEAVSYRLRMRIPEQDLAMAVVVQRMVDPRCAGVMFTCSPATGDRSVIAIEGAWGLGSALVCGDVTPDSYLISKVTGEILRRTVAAKLRRHQMDPGGCGVISTDVPDAQRGRPCLSDDEVRALAQVGRRVERHYGVVQDIEWAITDEGPSAGGIVLLQSRPETVWAGRTPGPIATPKARAVDHVFEGLGRVARVDADTGTRSGAPPWT